MEYKYDQIINSVVPKKRKLELSKIDELKNEINLENPKDSKKNKQKKKPITFLGVTGGQASGKSQLTKFFKKNIKECAIINEKSFFRKNKKPRALISVEDEKLFSDFPEYSKERRLYLMDSSNPDCYDLNQLYGILRKISNREKVKVPYFEEEKMRYNKSKDYTIEPEKTPIIIVEGYFIFKEKKILDLFKIKIFKDVQDDIRLARLVLREEKYLKKNVKAYELFFLIYEHFIKESFDKIIFNFKRSANMLLPDYSINENNELESDEAIEILKNTLNKLQI